MSKGAVSSGIAKGLRDVAGGSAPKSDRGAVSGQVFPGALPDKVDVVGRSDPNDDGANSDNNPEPMRSKP